MFQFYSLPANISDIPVESVILDENDGVFNKAAPGCWIVDHGAVFTSRRVVPAAEGDKDLDAVTLESRDFTVQFRAVLVSVGPRIKDTHSRLIGIQSGESIKDVSAEVQIDVSGRIFGFSLAIPRPVRVVTNHFVFVCQ